MGRPMLGDRPLTAVERNKRHRQKRRGIVESASPPEPSPEELLKQARREILELQREIDRLRAEAAGASANEHVAGPTPPSPQAASVSAATGEEVEAGEERPSSVWGLVQLVERRKKAGLPV
ncbi:hypothetical protein RFM99_00610 [Mesorhizobium sp. VK4C]|uniref:hypothetical protein n=1 Tax=Mesorhizobium captivum TaxID=3072319 RepID=UPI002A23BA97|nr:hypothetical protein [Mesorhizobium sp. VK4C]MDX8496908.1 hypothetical protein [Mesorhizobium sp. VK4C]